MKKYRNEWKYLSEDILLIPLEQQLQGILDRDSYTDESGKYTIHSLYFDDVYDTCARTNLAGDGIRFKYRIRYYNDNPNFLLLERKEKLNTYCHKKSAVLTKEEYYQILNQNVDNLLISKESVKKQFALDIITKGFSPKVIIDYERFAYVEPITNIRITFDKNIRASGDINAFLTGEYLSIPVNKGKQNVLEVKFDEVLPAYLRHVLESKKLVQQAFSKYYMGRVTIREHQNI